MKEAVIFPDPQDVTILATRNGELTQIPGSEFRAPLDIFGASIEAEWRIYNDVGALSIRTDEEISVKVHGLYQYKTESWSPDGVRPYCKPDPMKSYTWWIDPSFGTVSKIRYTTFWMRHPEYNYPYPQKGGTKMQILVEINGYYALEKAEIVDGEETSLHLPESHGTMAWLIMDNPNWDDATWGY